MKRVRHVQINFSQHSTYIQIVFCSKVYIYTQNSIQYTVFTNGGHAAKKLVPSHESEALEDKQKLQMKTFSELAECLARIPTKITFYGLLFKCNLRGMSSAFNV